MMQMPNPKTEPIFKVRELKDGSGFQVIMFSSEQAPELLIGDFSNEAQAKEWIKKDSISWLARRKTEIESASAPR
jgi:hypothetical protein